MLLPVQPVMKEQTTCQRSRWKTFMFCISLNQSQTSWAVLNPWSSDGRCWFHQNSVEGELVVVEHLHVGLCRWCFNCETFWGVRVKQWVSGGVFRHFDRSDQKTHSCINDCCVPLGGAPSIVHAGSLCHCYWDTEWNWALIIGIKSTCVFPALISLNAVRPVHPPPFSATFKSANPIWPCSHMILKRCTLQVRTM